MLYDEAFYEELSALEDDELVDKYLDSLGEAGACIDRDCSCKSFVAELLREIEDRGLEVPWS